MATAQEIFQAIESSLSDAAKADELADSFKGSALFYIKDKDLHYFLDLTQTSAEEAHRSRVVSGADASLRKEDASLLVTLNEETLIKLVSGALSPQLAFMTGKLKLKVRLSMREHAPDVSMSLSLSLSLSVCVCVCVCVYAPPGSDHLSLHATHRAPRWSRRRRHGKCARRATALPGLYR